MGRTVVVRRLKDGTGRTCIHWLRPDPKGLVHTGRREQPTEFGPMVFGGVTGTIACNPEQNTVYPQLVNGEILVCHHTIDANDAVTCPECRATPEFIATERLNRDNSQQKQPSTPAES